MDDGHHIEEQRKSGKHENTRKDSVDIEARLGLQDQVTDAFVLLKPGTAADAASARDILAFCKERLSPYKRSRCVEFAELPNTIFCHGSPRGVTSRLPTVRAGGSP